MAQTHEQKLTKARAHLIFKFPFFGLLALRLRYKESMEVPSMGTDGHSLFYNPGFLDKLTVKETSAVIAHEVLHCGLSHMSRRFHRQPLKWNYACDYAVDPIVHKSNLVMPTLEFQGMKFAPHIDSKYENMTADHIYSLLPEPPTVQMLIQMQGGDGEGGSDGEDQDQEPSDDQQKTYGSKGLGDVFDSPETSTGKNPSPEDSECKGKGMTKQQLEEIGRKEEIDWKLAMNEAAQSAKEQGKLPGHIEELIEDINKPQINWIAVLRTFMTDIRKDDFIWSRPNRRHITNDIFLPMRYSEGMGEVVLAVDTSGSISKAELAQFAGELNSILDDVKPSKVHVLYADTHVRHTEEFGPEDFPVKLHKHGGGGTDFSDPFYWTRDNCTNPECLIYLTDGYGDCSAERPFYPTLWVCTSKAEDFAPFGQVLPLEITDG